MEEQSSQNVRLKGCDHHNTYFIQGHKTFCTQKRAFSSLLHWRSIYKAHVCYINTVQWVHWFSLWILILFHLIWKTLVAPVWRKISVDPEEPYPFRDFSNLLKSANNTIYIWCHLISYKQGTDEGANRLEQIRDLSFSSKLSSCKVHPLKEATRRKSNFCCQSSYGFCLPLSILPWHIPAQ